MANENKDEQREEIKKLISKLRGRLGITVEEIEKEEMWYQLTKPPMTEGERTRLKLIDALRERAEKTKYE